MTRRRGWFRRLIAVVTGLLVPLAGFRPAGAASVAGRVVVDGSPAVEAVVALQRSGDGSVATASPAPSRVVMDQKHLTFHPRVLPVLRGTVVEFTNNDDVEHNVFSPSKVAGAFNLGTYSHGQVREVRLDNVGEVDVLCNIHMEMEAHILVLDQPYFAVSGAEGAYEVRELPAGQYELSVWDDGWLPTKQTVKVTADQAAHLDVVGRR